MKKIKKGFIILSLFSFIILNSYDVTFAKSKKIKMPEIGSFVVNLENLEKEYSLKSDGLIKVTSPKSNKIYKVGDSVKVKWIDKSLKDYNTTVLLVNEDIMFPVSFFEDETRQSYHDFIITDDMPSGKYFIMLGDDGSKTRFAISNGFEIKTQVKKADIKNGFEYYVDDRSLELSSELLSSELNLDNARVQAEIFYDINGNYSNVCKKDADKDSGIRNYVKEAGKSSGGKTDCDSSANAWSAEVKLKSSKMYYCVDSTGYAGEQKNSKGSKAIACDGTKAESKSKSTSKNVKDIISEEDHFLSGNMNSKVKIVTYSDLECPYCASFDQTVRKISKEYGDKVAFIFRHFPLSQIHANAELAANASECVANLGNNKKFSSYIEKLFLNSYDLSFDNLSTIAKSIGIDKKSFDSCLLKNKYSDKVNRDKELGTKISDKTSMFGTPYSIVYNSNGYTQVIEGAQPYNDIKRIIESVILK